MMNQTYEDANVGCPYYNEESARRIICEGLSDHSTTQQIFPARDEKVRFKQTHCCANWKSCPLTKALNEKYDYVP